MDCSTVFRVLLLYVVLVTEKLATTFANTSEAPLLRCYKCNVIYNAKWTPYSACQTNVTSVDVATCTQNEKYCKVEHVTVKGATISLTRKCSDTCYYGCRLRGFGVTQLRCSSCCTKSLCNTGAGTVSAVHVSREASTRIFLSVLGCVALTLRFTLS